MSTVETVELATPPTHQSFRISTPNIPMAPKIAREQVALLLRLTDHTELVDVAMLLVSEIVTNVHLHTATPIVDLDVTVWCERVQVAVWDDAPRRCPYVPRPAPDTPVPNTATLDAVALEAAVRTDERPGDPLAGDAEHGRGLALVEELASAWGITWPHQPRRPAKCVWFALDDRTGALDDSALSGGTCTGPRT
ncbi:ATP-binding protein [Streptomyces zagrosensis]|uniref:Histidine kinase/HSP90-like ATPase domain-containing protein n=1 Tax=Streptomyces zagrosensis TaxID=1042984 RepID=A0A7W9QD69_9ACTN|nr:ATP-binding protein [Streptomyces zagrosensis]MBB5938060.1 hypothetical protein [Streptomyces zagrosensis]